MNSYPTHLYHVNPLKEWHKEAEDAFLTADVDWDEKEQWRTNELRQVEGGTLVFAWQSKQTAQVLEDFPDVFVDTPGQ